MYLAAVPCIYRDMSARTQRERAEYAGYGWGMCSLFLGLLTLGMLIGPGDWNLARVASLIVIACGAYYSFQAYDKAQRRSRNHPSSRV